MTQIIPEYCPSDFRNEVDIIAIREALKWSKTQMGDHMGCHRSKIARWESGFSVIGKLAQKEYWQLWFENGLHEKHDAEISSNGHRETSS